MNFVITPAARTLISDQRCLLLFNVGKPLEISLQEFYDDWWLLVSNIWTVFSHKNLVNGDSWKTFTCRFAKSCPSSSQKENIPPDKRRKTK
ncbi:18606_t:CDS:1, partial [Gigaspora rosea]